MNLRDLTYKINGAIFEVHRTLGEGFLEKVYETGKPLGLLINLKGKKAKIRRLVLEKDNDLS